MGLIQRTERRGGKEIAQPKPAHGCSPAYMANGGKFIQSAIKKPGQLHRDLGVPQGEKIPASSLAAAAKLPGKVGQRARFAETLKGMNK